MRNLIWDTCIYRDIDDIKQALEENLDAVVSYVDEWLEENREDDDNVIGRSYDVHIKDKDYYCRFFFSGKDGEVAYIDIQ